MGKILKEQPDKSAAIKHIASLLDRIAMLWQIPNWTAMNAVVLAEWIFEFYKYDSVDMVIECLKNPKPSSDKTWRLTPDVVQEWMTEHQEREAQQREKEHEQMKIAERSVKPSESYEDFYKKNFFEFDNNVMKQPEKTKDQALEDFRSKYYSDRIRKQNDNLHTE